MNFGILSKLQRIQNTEDSADIVLYDNESYIFGMTLSERFIETSEDEEYNGKRIKAYNRQYSLYCVNDFSGVPVAQCAVRYSMLKTQQQEYYKKWGMREVPKHFFYIDYLYVQLEYQNQNIGSFLLNLVVEDLVKFSKDKRIPLNIELETVDTNQAKAFYKKWGAESNNYDSNKIEGYLIIRSPQQKQQYTRKKVCPFKVISVDRKKFLVKASDLVCEKE